MEQPFSMPLSVEYLENKERLARELCECRNTGQASEKVDFTMPLLKQNAVPVPDLGVMVEPFKTRVDVTQLLSGAADEAQFRYLGLDNYGHEVIRGLSYFEARRYAQRNGASLLTRGEWYKTLQFFRQNGIENDFITGNWELTDTFVEYDSGQKSGGLFFLRERSQLLELASGYSIIGGRIIRATLPMKDLDDIPYDLAAAFVTKTNKNGLPAEALTKAESINPAAGYFLPGFDKKIDGRGVIVCAGDFGPENEQFRDRSIILFPLNFRHFLVSFRLCYKI